MSHKNSEVTPLLTVLVVTRNNEAQIRECLCGLMEQSVAARMEVIVLDQGSEQAEWAVIHGLQQKYGNLISLRLPAAAASFSGVDKALAMASGSYLSILRATDRIGKDSYERLMATLEQRGGMVAYGDAEFPSQALWRREALDSIGPFGSDDNALRDFLSRALDRLPVVQVQESHAAEVPAGATASVASIADPDQALAAITNGISGDDAAQAMAALERHLQSFPDHAIAHNNLAAVSYQAGDTDKALQHYRKAVQLAPEELVYQKNLADLLYIVAGEVNEAIGIYLELLKRSPRDVEVLLNLGIICEDVKQPDEAESFYQRALELEPWNQVVRERLTELRNQTAAPAETETAPEESAEEHYQRAQALVAKGDLDGAAREMEKLVAVHPDFAAAYNDLGVLNYQKGFKDQALAHYEKAATLAPENSTYQKNLADFYFVEGHNVDGAIAIYLEQLRKEPRDVDTLMNLAKICEILDRPREAESFYGKVTELEPWNMTARECLSSLRHCANG